MNFNRNRVFYICVGSIFILCLFLLLQCRKGTGVSLSATDRTIGTIKQYEWLESASGYLDSNQIVPFLRSNEAAGFSLNKVFRGMQLYPQDLPENLMANAKIHSPTNIDEIKDGWGNPILFMWCSSAQTGQISEGLLRKQFPVLIWSCGKNGSNEYGHGDDVYSDQVK